jgi:hypothetical protein
MTERDACEQFSYELENEGIKEIVDELSLLLVHVRRELNGIDIQEKEKQKEDENDSEWRDLVKILVTWSVDGICRKCNKPALILSRITRQSILICFVC